MSIIAPYFISILLSFPMLADTPVPSSGWLQWVFEFPNKATCEEFLVQEEEQIYITVTARFLRIPHEIKELQCMTVEEGMAKNKELGHQFTIPLPPKQQKQKPIIPRV